jgi:pilus assembly protein Flp/PilA
LLVYSVQWASPREVVQENDMTNFFGFKKALWEDESGATAIEYGLLAALIAVVIIGAVATLGGTLDRTFESVNTEILAENPGLADAD